MMLVRSIDMTFILPLTIYHTVMYAHVVREFQKCSALIPIRGLFIGRCFPHSIARNLF